MGWANNSLNSGGRKRYMSTVNNTRDVDLCYETEQTVELRI